MKIFQLFLITVLILSGCNSQLENPSNKEDAEAIQYDSVAAAKYGADDYGMKKYVMAFLKRGPNRSASPEEASRLQKAHLDNITRLAEEGKLVLAGPFFGDGDLRGIYVFDVQSIEEAEELTGTDPSIKAGVLEMELLEWYGSAALMALNDIHRKIEKKGITD
jgi:uncharacterized protein YciI